MKWKKQWSKMLSWALAMMIIVGSVPSDYLWASETEVVESVAEEAAENDAPDENDEQPDENDEIEEAEEPENEANQDETPNVAGDSDTPVISDTPVVPDESAGSDLIVTTVSTETGGSEPVTQEPANTDTLVTESQMTEVPAVTEQAATEAPEVEESAIVVPETSTEAIETSTAETTTEVAEETTTEETEETTTEETATETETEETTTEEEPAEISVSISGKVSYNEELKAGQFTFRIREVDETGSQLDGGFVASAKNDADGGFTFDEIVYEKAGIYYYKVSQKNGGQTVEDIKYDGAVYTVTVEVTENEDGLSAEVDKDASAIRFVNEYVEPEKETEADSFTYSGEGISAEVELSEAIPADAEFVVKEKDSDSSYYSDAVSQVKEWALANKLAVSDALVFDMHFEKDGKTYQIDGDANVTLKFDSPVLAGAGSGRVLHIADGVHDVTGSVSQNDDGSVSAVTIHTSGFSPFVVAKVNTSVRPLRAPARAGSSTSSNLNEFLVEVQITPNEADEEGNNKIIEGKEYLVSLSFEEGQNLQFGDDGVFTYTYPSQIVPTSIPDTNFGIKVTDEKGTFTQGFSCSIEGNQVIVKIDKEDLNYQRFAACANIRFNVEAKIRFEEIDNKQEINFGNGHTINVVPDNSASVDVAKTASYNRETGKVDYVVTVTSNGNNHNVVVRDTITGSLLTYDDNLTTASNKNTVLPLTDKTKKENGFEYIIPALEPDEVITLHYSASVKFDDLKGSISAEQSGNTVTAQSDEDVDGDSDTKNVEYQISHTPLSKTKPNDSYQDGDTIPWTIKLNEDCNGTLPDTVTDTITTPEYLKYSGEGINVVIKDAEGNKVYAQKESWERLTSKTDSSWTYTIPEAYRGNNYSCTITYDTVASAGTSSIDVSFGNKATDGRGNESAGSGTVGPSAEYGLSYSKEAVHVTHEEVQWKVTVDVPDGGMDKFEVTDTLPTTQVHPNISNGDWSSKTVFDSLKKDGDDYKLSVDNLLDGESYDLVYADGGDSFVLKFFYMDGAVKKYGLKPGEQRKDLVISFTTVNDKEWLSETDYWGAGDAQKHKNNVKINDFENVQATAVVPISTKVEKSVGCETVSIEGVQYPVYKYTVVLQGIRDDRVTIEDTFPTEYLKLYDEFPPTFRAGDNNWDSGKVGGTINSVVPTNKGIEFDLTIAQNENGAYYNRYILEYKLIVKDKDALAKLAGEALKSESGKKILRNTARIQGTTSEDSAEVIYDYDPLDKSCTVEASANNNYVSTFKIEINKAGAKLMDGEGTLTVTDRMSKNLRYMPETLQITPSGLSGIETSLVEEEEGNVLEIKGLPDQTQIEITYSARVVGTGAQTYSNSVSVIGYGSTDSIERRVHVEYSGTGGGSNPYIYIYKYAYGSLETPLEGAVFKLQTEGNEQWEDVLDSNGKEVTITTDSNGKATLSGDQSQKGWVLWANRKYRLIETEAPDGYSQNGEPIEFTIRNIVNSQDDYLIGDTINISNVRENFHIVKKDSTTGNCLSGAEFTLTQVNGDIKEIVTSNESGIVSFSKLLPGTYSLKETKAPAGYVKDETTYKIVVGDDLRVRCETEGLTITENNGVFSGELSNTPDVSYGILTVSKTLAGNDTDSTKDFHFKITLNDTSINETYSGVAFKNGIATFTLRGGESKTIEGLPNGVGYTVTEVEANQDGYITTSTGATGTISETKAGAASFTNTRDTYGDLMVSKTVEGNAPDKDKAFEFTVTLSDTTLSGTYGDMTFSDGVAVFSLKDGEKKKAKNLPTGVRYTVEEKNYKSDGYVTTKSGDAGTISGGCDLTAAFTNTRDAEGSLTVSKTLAGNDTDSTKDFNFKITLNDTSINETYSGVAFKNGIATFTLKGGESKTIEGLPNGVGYTVTEVEANQDGYITTSMGATGTISETKAGAASFTNTRNTYGDLTVSKTVEGNAPDKDKAFEFTVTLSDTTLSGTYGDMTFSDGVAVFSLKDGEQKKATGLPNGVTYEVKEADYSAESYTTSKSGDTGTITGECDLKAEFVNTFESTNISGSKTWNDADNKNGKRPGSITVNLLADGTKVDSKEVTEIDKWEWNFTDLPKYKGGKEIKYTITEEPIEDYTATVNGFNITNDYTPNITSRTVTKVWSDAENQDGKRPTEVRVQLLADKEPYGDEITLNAATNWEYTWSELPQKQNGTDVVYTVKEVDVPEGYTVACSKSGTSFIITNTYTPETTEVKGSKIWDDALNRDGRRPAEIAVNIMDGKEIVQTIHLSAGEDKVWQVPELMFISEKLPKYRNGKEIVYTIKEVAVAGYVDSYTVKENGTIITNTYTPETTTISGSKIWDDEDDRDGKRPDSITVYIKDGDKTVDTIHLSAGGDKVWQDKELKFTSKELPKFRDGNEIVYTVEEAEVADYTASYDGTVITNKYVPEEETETEETETTETEETETTETEETETTETETTETEETESTETDETDSTETEETESTTPETESTPGSTPETESTPGSTPGTESTPETESKPETTTETVPESPVIPSAPGDSGDGSGYDGDGGTGGEHSVMGVIRGRMGQVLGAMRGVLGARVRTGDESFLFAIIYAVLMIAAIGAITVVVIKRRRKKNMK